MMGLRLLFPRDEDGLLKTEIRDRFTGACLLRFPGMTKGRNLSEEDLQNANLACFDLTETDFEGALLRQADLRQADLTRTDFTGADVRWPYSPSELIAKTAPTVGWHNGYFVFPD